MRHMIIPDTQVKPGVETSHLDWAAQYAVDMKPDVIVMIGDWWDMPSLSSYDRGKGCMEGRRYKDDVEAGNNAMAQFLNPIKAEQNRQRKNKKPIWRPRMVFCMGNHEDRINRAINDDIRLDGVIGFHDLDLSDWEVYDFLEVVTLDGVAYSHFFTSGVMGRPVTSARAMLSKKHMSTVMGHTQDKDIAFARRADGTAMTGIHVGAFYQHDESYLNPQTNESWKGVWILNDVQDGAFDELPVSIDYLKRKYA